MIQFDTDELNKLIKNFYNITKIKICVFNENFEEIAFYPARYSSICELVHSTERGLALCASSDKVAFKKCLETKKHFIYTCHLGLTEAVTPILISNFIVGYIMLGQVLQGDDEGTIGRILCSCDNLGIDRGLSTCCLRDMEKIEEDKIHSASHILDACASYLYLAKQVEIIGDDVAVEIDNYISKNLAKQIDVLNLCSEFLLTRVQLYEVFKHYFGNTVGGYIKKKRMDKATFYLSTTDLMVNEVAEKVGYDYNYFSKIFKKEKGVTPKNFQKKNIEK